jgi:uncharacterized membrane protein YqjE
MPERGTESPTVELQNESLPALLGRLTDELTKLVDAKLDLLKAELKEELSAYAVGLLLLLIGMVIATVGFALLNVAIAFLLSMLFDTTHLSPAGRYGLGFIISAFLYLIIGAIIILIAKDRLAKQSITPKRSAIELKRDKEWLKKQL